MRQAGEWGLYEATRIEKKMGWFGRRMEWDRTFSLKYLNHFTKS